MANFGFTFDPSTVEGKQTALPAGTYVAQIIEADVKPTKAGTGMILKLTWSVAEGPNEKRRFWQNVNIQNASAEAQRIGQAELKEITAALGLGPISSSDPLLFKPLVVTVSVEPDQNGVDRNQVRKVAAYGPKVASPKIERATGPNPGEVTGPTESPAGFGQAKPAATGARSGTPWGAKKSAA